MSWVSGSSRWPYTTCKVGSMHKEATCESPATSRLCLPAGPAPHQRRCARHPPASRCCHCCLPSCHQCLRTFSAKVRGLFSLLRTTCGKDVSHVISHSRRVCGRPPTANPEPRAPTHLQPLLNLAVPVVHGLIGLHPAEGRLQQWLRAQVSPTPPLLGLDAATMQSSSPWAGRRSSRSNMPPS